MIVLALDPSSKAIGWSVGSETIGRLYGAWRPLDGRAMRQETNERHRELCGRASWWLSDMLTEHAPEVLVIEVGGGYQTDKCSERLRGALLAVAWVREIATIPVAPATWQAWQTRNAPARLTDWKANGKPDADAADMMLEWALATQTMEAA